VWSIGELIDATLLAGRKQFTLGASARWRVSNSLCAAAQVSDFDQTL
jgi:hypothetical protein